MGLLDDKNVLITGAAGDIGAAIAVAAAREGAASIVLTDHRAAELPTVATNVENTGARAFPVAADLESEEAISSLVDEALALTGGIDVLVNAAGVHERTITSDTGIDQLSSAIWRRVMAVNLTAPWLLTRQLAPSMAARGGGSIVNVASQLGVVATEGMTAYCTSKAGLMQLTRSAALDLAPQGIRCNCVAPGAIETQMTDQIFAAAPDPARNKAAALETYLIKRFGVPDEVAAAVCFLASDLSSWTTGSCLVVDGGQTAWR